MSEVPVYRTLYTSPVSVSRIFLTRNAFTTTPAASVPPTAPVKWYLAHKKHPPPRTLQYEDQMVVLGGGAVSYERGTPWKRVGLGTPEMFQEGAATNGDQRRLSVAIRSAHVAIPLSYERGTPLQACRKQGTSPAESVAVEGIGHQLGLCVRERAPADRTTVSTFRIHSIPP